MKKEQFAPNTSKSLQTILGGNNNNNNNKNNNITWWWGSDW
jgi:hypothetical protein